MSILLIFGFCTLSFFLAIVSDIYEDQLNEKRSAIKNIGKYVAGLDEFSFQTRTMKVIPIRLKSQTVQSWFEHGHGLISRVPSSQKSDEPSAQTRSSGSENEVKLSALLKNKPTGDRSEPVRFRKIGNLITHETYLKFIDLVVILHTLSFLIAKSNIAILHIERGDKLNTNAKISNYVDLICTLIYVFEMTLNYIVFGYSYFTKFSHAFDLFVTLSNVAKQFEDLHVVIEVISHFRFSRVVGVLTSMWRALRMIGRSVSLSLNSLVIIVCVFLVIFFNLSFLGNRLFDYVHTPSKERSYGTFLQLV